MYMRGMLRNLRNKMGSSQSVAPAFRPPWQQFDDVMREMDESVKKRILSEFREVNEEMRIQEAVSRQLDDDLMLDAAYHHIDGTFDSPLYQKLPVEIRQTILSYVVTVDQSVHVFPPKGSEFNGFRLSLCEEASYDFEMGHCRCDDNPARNRVQSDFFDNAIFLVSQSVRREALDAFFMTNSFTFTCLYELVRFASTFKRSSSKIQRLRILERVDDYPSSEFRIEGVQKTRLRLKSLKHLDLHVYLSTWSAYESLYEDGLIHQLLHFALGPPPVTKQAKRKASCLDDDSDLTYGIIFNASKSQPQDKATQTTPPPTTPTTSDDQAQQTQTSSETVLRTRLHTYNALTPSEIGSFFPNVHTPFNFSMLASLTRQNLYDFPPKNTTSTDSNSSETSPSPFPIPPLRSFSAHITTRTHLRPLAPTDAKAAYYEALYARLKRHLEDVFLDNGRTYRRIEDIPSLGPRPKSRQRDEDRPLAGAEKRGLLILRD